MEETTDFTFYLGERLIHIEVDDKVVQVLKQDDFIDWCDKEGKLDWCLDYNDPAASDGHGQVVGKYTPDEYWMSVRHSDIIDDLREYLKFKSIIQSP